MADKLETIVETYFAALRDVHSLGAGTKERSYYPALADLFNAIGAELRPKVLCLSDLGNTGAGHPDFGLFASNQVQRGEPRRGQVPERGVVEVKSTDDDAWLIAETRQVTKYFDAYRLVVVTNLRDFLIIGEGPDGQATRLECFSLAPDAKAFWSMIASPRKAAKQIGKLFGEYLTRGLTQKVALTEPKHLAWFIASYARDALQRVESAGDLAALTTVRSSLEQALGVSFETDKGDHFFRSTLVQTLFYGVFSAWVLWARETPRPSPVFDWKSAVWHLNVPFVRTLFQQLASPAHLQPLHLVELLDWTASTLNRVDPTNFLARFNDADAVQFFYEPFLEAFDPELRKELGVWYTPTEVVTYMVARIDKALREDLGVSDGLASEQVYILDPCCGTGAYLAAVLRRIDESLDERGYGALKGQMVKKAALERVFGFEIMPAPFVVAHLKVGLVLKSLGATLDEDHERASIYLTNALTGWEPVEAKPLPFPELEAERKRADGVKQEAPILVILGNPPYNGYAGMAMQEERDLSNAYRTTKRVRRPEGQGLNDLYVRFFRMAERRIADKTGKGIVSFISNYSWLDGSSFTGMRERYLEAFDLIRIDRLNGDKYRTGKTTPDGRPDPSIFSTEHNREGIQVGTAIATLVRKLDHEPTTQVAFRDLWGVGKREALLATAEATVSAAYEFLVPPLELGLPFVITNVDEAYYHWPKLAELMPTSFPGVKTSRDEFVVAVDRSTLEERLSVYFDPTLSDDDVRKVLPAAMLSNQRFDAVSARGTLASRGVLMQNIIRYLYRPFDVRYLYWEPSTKLLDEKRAEYFQAYVPDTTTIITPKSQRKDWSPPLVAHCLVDLNAMDGGALAVPLSTRDLVGHEGGATNVATVIAQSDSTFSHEYQTEIGFHCLAILHSPRYREENKTAMRGDEPRVPFLLDDVMFKSSVELGRSIAGLLDPEKAVSGVSDGKIRPALQTLAIPHAQGGGHLAAADLNLSAGWGHLQTSRAGSAMVMPGGGLFEERDYTPSERAAINEEATTLGIAHETALNILGSRTLNIGMNSNAMWLNVPENVWDYTLGGYQVVKKWLSYREQSILGRPLTVDEVAYLSEMVRRIAAILLMGPALDANYEAAKANAVEWRDGRPVVTTSASV